MRLGDEGRVVLGKGSDPDIMVASAKAYLNGLNRLDYMKTHGNGAAPAASGQASLKGQAP